MRRVNKMAFLVVLVILGLLSACGQKTVIEIPGSGNNSVSLTINVKEDKALSLAPSTAVSRGSAESSGTSSTTKETK